MFKHVEIDLPHKLERVHIDGKRYYKLPGEDIKLVSVTTVTSFQSAKKIKEWRKRVGEEYANRKTKRATSRGTGMHTLTEHFLKNEPLPKSNPLPEILFKVAKPTLKKINNIHALERPLYSKTLGLAGTVDCIAEYEGELAVIDFKTAEKPKPEEWIDGYFVQAVAYACMLYEMTGIIVKKLVIIMSCENGECKVYEKTNKSEYIRKLTQYIREWKSANE